MLIKLQLHECDYNSKSLITRCANSLRVTSAAHRDAVFLLMLTCLRASTLQQITQVQNTIRKPH